MTQPLLSVVIPTWNRAGMVCDAVASALCQRSGQVEVIVVDDGSTDNTVNLLRHTFGSQISLLRLPERLGVSAARNKGTRLATGELVAYLDSDDVWLPGKLDAELRLLEKYPDAEAVISDSLRFVNGQPDQQSRFSLIGLLEASAGQPCWVSECRWLWTNSMKGVQMSAMTLRRQILDRIEGPLFAEDLIWCEDWEFQMRLFHSRPVMVLPEVWTQARCVDDGARLGRWNPGKAMTSEQEVGLLSARLKVMERAHWLTGLDSHLATELERFRHDTIHQLARHNGSR